MAAATEIQPEKNVNAKGIEAFVRTRLARVQARFDELGDKVKGQVADLKKTLATAPEQTLSRFKKVSAVLEDKRLAPLKEVFETVQKRLDQLKQTVDGLLKRKAEAPAATPSEPAANS